MMFEQNIRVVGVDSEKLAIKHYDYDDGEGYRLEIQRKKKGGLIVSLDADEIWELIEVLQEVGHLE